MSDAEKEVPPQEGEEAFDFGLKKKKKGTKKKKKDEQGEAAAEGGAAEGGVSEFKKGPVYAYDELLKRVQDIIAQQNGDLAGRKKISVKPPKMERVSTKKVGWTNFEEICQMLNRSPDHLFHFVLVELATEGSIAGPQLILKGRFGTKHIESLLRRYIREYVTCKMCNSSNTKLEKDHSTRLQIIKCSACGAFRTVAAIKAGYHAQTRADRKKAKQAAG
uniref:Translation initiation factor IF2/IF5 domain-containing protein n=1 Tax=Chromera velia CCMP2878 TaxID=1169474 RepID=A0A0G4IC10_9ALVE|mmetsp:Transcript_43039/g.84862  ORF Transcript_43039/g.84862 Transcript_43039/m.84862 type:complete len:219 (+) Transcript_43039:170-826(+)|eukprot:Cvel_2244.t1-p1 / transcript=Cvel_2244.t1 / gene=Cvel_2244 / organism=Chromera_velia_CCMP2878 / gene_product=Eukaryotic translation initiation factor 2 subunit, putative / transcript_product=Eukaryotic translation initiation factor 2 subunit, putative / location=Cvel_scaffold86:114935-117894(+) / protein_length=218 / sequence_SO=supercontig / SO=protein_coding / is_pseudo=false